MKTPSISNRNPRILIMALELIIESLVKEFAYMTD